MSSTDCRRASSNEGAFLMTSSTSWRTCSRRWADLRARSVFQGFSSSRDNAMLTSIVSFLHRTSFTPRPETPPGAGMAPQKRPRACENRGIIAPGRRPIRLPLFAQEPRADPVRLLTLEALDAADDGLHVIDGTIAEV